MSIEDLPIDISTFRTPIVTETPGMFICDDAIYTNNLGYLQTEEDVFLPALCLCLMRCG
jgi:hypothetical protein